MEKFYEWMFKKGYKQHGSVSGHDMYYEPMNQHNEPTQQMLIGYMIEYLLNFKYMELRIPFGENKLFNSIDELYEDLKQKIEAV